jgi:hypothetical protein
VTPIQIASDALAVIGLVVLGVSLYGLLRRKLDSRAANEMILKVSSSRALTRTLRLTMAAPGTYLDAIAAGIAAGIAAQSRDAGAVAAAVHTAFDATGKPLLARARRLVMRGLAGAALVGCGIALAASEYVTRPLVGAAAAAGIGTLGLLGQGASMGRALATARHIVLPSLIAIIADEPPPPTGLV